MRLPRLFCRWLFPVLLSVPMLPSTSLSADDQTDGDRSATKTAKERLVNKAADAQRVNDCKVPIKQRDLDHPRPDDCRGRTDAEPSEPRTSRE